jgi:hypothetical protein
VGPCSPFSMNKLTELLDHVESVPKDWHKIPLCGSRFENLFNKLSPKDFNSEGYYTLGSIFIQKRGNMLTENIVEHECLELVSNNIQSKIRSLKARVFSALDIPKIYKPSRKYPPIPLLPFALLFDSRTRKNFTLAHKEFIRAQNEGGIIKAYYTRLKDGVEAPVSPQIFQDSMARVMTSKINLLYKNFQLELFLRVLPSKNKTLKMKLESIDGFDGTPLCTRCGVVSDSSHQSSYCIFPTFSLYALNESKSWLHEAGICEKINPIHLEFHTPVRGVAKKWKSQLDIIFIAIKRAGFNLWQRKDFNTFSKYLMQITLIREIRGIVELSRGMRQPQHQRILAEMLLDELIQEQLVHVEFYTIKFDHLQEIDSA